MAASDWILGAAVIGGIGVVAYLYFTGYFSGFKTYDPSRTDLFPFAPTLEAGRQKAKDELARLTDVLKPK